MFIKIYYYFNKKLNYLFSIIYFLHNCFSIFLNQNNINNNINNEFNNDIENEMIDKNKMNEYKNKMNEYKNIYVMNKNKNSNYFCYLCCRYIYDDMYMYNDKVFCSKICRIEYNSNLIK